MKPNFKQSGTKYLASINFNDGEEVYSSQIFDTKSGAMHYAYFSIWKNPMIAKVEDSDKIIWPVKDSSNYIDFLQGIIIGMSYPFDKVK